MMELDGIEYDRYLAVSAAFSTLSQARNPNSSAGVRGMNGHGGGGGGGGGGDRPGGQGGGGGGGGGSGGGGGGGSMRRASTPGMVGAVGMDEIVAENARELRRRSLASGYHIQVGFIDATGGESYGRMIHAGPAGGFTNGELTSIGAGDMARLPATIETSFPDMVDPGSASDLNAVGMMGVGNLSGPEINSSISMYTDPQGLSGTSNSSPATNSMAVSVPQSPIGGAGGGGGGNHQINSSPMSPNSHGHRMSVDSITPSPMSQMHMAQITSQAMDQQALMDQMGGMTPSSQYSPMQVGKHFNETTYSSTGFDMMGILYRVAHRPNPQINIGAVDFSCSFVVTDARKFDNPIVYCSATFERLTGYTRHEILGRNCRFLQAPDSKIVPGVKRKYVDDDAVYYLKNQIQAKKEAQTSLINYRKGGQPFTNLLTMIPITWDSPEVVYFVGFQVDLVEQPGAMVQRNKDGSFAINYQYSQLPTYVPAAAGALALDQSRSGLTVARDDVSHVLSSFGNGDSEFQSKRILDKVLLENTDDVVHVLSLKGLFLYCSPSIRRVLEYEPQELVGTSLSAVCHPSDIVPVTRDLKDTSSSTSVNVVFRIRRKYSGYTWFESHGSLHTEQGKGRKCIILVGRERPVYRLGCREVQVTGGIGENELWTKMSTSGMFLFVSSNAKALLDREGDELVGTSVQALMRPDSRNEIGRALENARNGTKATVKHEIQNKRGQFLQALTTLFPGDGIECQKPTFLVAQTRLLKHTRANAGSPNKAHQSDALSSAASTPSWSNSSPIQTSHMTNGVDKTPAPQEQREGDGGDLTPKDENLFEELKTTRSTSWQFELRQLQRTNKRLVEELSSLIALRKKRKRRKGVDQMEKDCANCHTRVTPEWRRGPSGKRDLCNSCGLRYAKLVSLSLDPHLLHRATPPPLRYHHAPCVISQYWAGRHGYRARVLTRDIVCKPKIGRVSPRTTTSTSDKGNTSPTQSQSQSQSSPITAHSHSLADSPHHSSARTAGMTPIPISPVHQQLRRGSMGGSNMPPLQPHPASTPHINGNGEIEMKIEMKVNVNGS